MKYKVLWIKGVEKDYRCRVYMISKEEFEDLRFLEVFVLRETTNGQRIYRSCADKHYMIC